MTAAHAGGVFQRMDHLKSFDFQGSINKYVYAKKKNSEAKLFM